MDGPTGIVVASDEELFIELMERFSPQTHLVQYAESLPEAAGYCANSPGLMVVSVDQPSAELDQLLNSCVLNDVRILGLSRQEDVPDLPLDRLAPADDRELVYRAAAELLNERRSYPRVQLQLEVEVEGLGRAYCSSASAVSMFVETEAVLTVGTQVAIQIPHAAGVVSGTATVVRAGLGGSGNVGMVLAVSGEVGAFLRAQVREALRAYYEQWLAQAPQVQAQPAQDPQPEPDYQSLNVSGFPDDADAAYDEAYDEPSTNVQELAPIALSEQVHALQARLEKQQKIIEKVVLRVRELDRAKEPPPDAAVGADPEALAEVQQQLATIGERIETVEHEREPLQAGLFESSERVAELERRIEALARDDSADRLAELRGTVDALGMRVETMEDSAVSRDAVDAGHQELTEKLNQLEQAQEKTAQDLEERLEQQRVSLQATVEEPGERVAELTQQLDQLRDDVERAQTKALEAQQEATQAQQQKAEELEQRLQTELEELEQRMQAGQSPLRDSLEQASQRLVELAERIDELGGKTVAELQEQQRVAEKRLAKVERVASDAATQDALESSGEALLHRTEQLAQRVERAEETVLQVTRDLEQAQEAAQQRNQAQGDTAQEVEKRLEGRLAELQEWVAEMGNAIPNEKVLNDREKALTRRIEALIDSRLQETARESARSVKESVSQETATALESLQEIRTEVRALLEDMVQQLGEARAQIDAQAKVLSKVVHRLDRMQKD